MNIDLAPLDYLKEQHVHLCIVTRTGTLSEATFHSYLKWNEIANQMGIAVTVDTVRDDIAAKNALVGNFLITPGTTHMLFVDADVEFEPWYVLALLSSKKHVIGAASTSHLPGMAVEQNIKEVSEVNLGFIMLSQEALTYLQDKPFDPVRSICTSWREIGGHVWSHDQVTPNRAWSS